MKKIKNIFINILLPGIILSGFIGFAVGIVIFFYKYTWNLINKNSKFIYEMISNKLILVIPGLLVIIGLAFIQTITIKHVHESRGGGIPTSEGIVRGLLGCRPYSTFIAVIVLSFISVFIGVPLGSEGPSVLLGTALSNAFAKVLPEKKYRAYKRYIMTGGSSTAFAVATGAPIAGILFALEEIHRKFSPMILLVSMSSVLCGTYISQVLSNLFNVPFKMFNDISTLNFPIEKIWMFVLVGLIVGVLSIAFAKSIELFKYLFETKTSKIHIFYKILSVFIISFILAIFLPDSIYGGHSLIEGLIENKYELYLLIIILLIKFLLVSYTSFSGVTGGLFIPMLAIGSLLGAILAKIFNINEYSTIFISASMVAFMGASVGCPLSAIVFACETLNGLENIFPILICVFVSFATFKMFGTNHVYDIVLEGKLKNKFSFRDFEIAEFKFVVSENSFACYKTTRDLLLPPNAIILSVQRKDKAHFKMDNFGDKILHEGDIVTLRVQTYNNEKTKKEIESFFGYQEELEKVLVQEKKY